MTALDLAVHLEHRVEPRRTRRASELHSATPDGPVQSPTATERTVWPDHEFTD